MAKRLTKRAASAPAERPSRDIEEFRAQLPDLFVKAFDKNIERLKAEGFNCDACKVCSLSCPLAIEITLRRRFSGELKVTNPFAWVKDTLPPKQDEPRRLLDMERDGTRWGRA